MKIDKFGLCPECGFNFKGKNIFNELREQKCTEDMSDEELRQDIKESYPDTDFFSHVININIGERYDPASYVMCPKCKTKWNSETGEEKNDR